MKVIVVKPLKLFSFWRLNCGMAEHTEHFTENFHTEIIWLK